MTLCSDLSIGYRTLWIFSNTKYVNKNYSYLAEISDTKGEGVALRAEADINSEKYFSIPSGEKIYLSYINENLGSELSVELLSSRMYLSKSHFMRLFSEATGTTVHSYILQRRLLNASRMIREGTDAAEAARLNGFEDYSSFYRAFRKKLGVSPRNIKK